MSALFLIAALWSVIDQSHFLFGANVPAPILKALASTGRPVLTMYIIALVLTSLSVVIPAYRILHSEKALKGFQDFMERLSTLSVFYLFLSLVGLIIVVIRNI